MKPIRTLLAAVLLPAAGAPAMDRLDALSQIESGNNDHAIGRQQEVSRYQILPVFWIQAEASDKPASPTDPAAAKAVVCRIMAARSRAFEARYHRQPTDFEYYVLWHRPACLVGRSPLRPLAPAEMERARRFASLCQPDGYIASRILPAGMRSANEFPCH